MASGGWHELAPKYWDDVLDRATKRYWYWSTLSASDKAIYEQQSKLQGILARKSTDSLAMPC
eukprot:3345663-Amphidinium_carterae.1